MKRQAIRDMKRNISAAAEGVSAPSTHRLARESARALLDRSIGFGHRRLAVIRLAMAVHSGAELTPEHWAYCQEAAEKSRDTALQQVLAEAVATASTREMELAA